MSDPAHYDFVIIGGGPGGLKAALEAAEHGQSVLMVECEPDLGGSCAHYGTIPSKALRETAMALEGFKRRTGSVFEVAAPEEVKVAGLMIRLEQVVRGHESFLSNLLGETCIQHRHGRGRFIDPQHVEILSLDGTRETVTAGRFIIATGSSPRMTDEIPIDHSHLLTSDSIHRLTYLPKSLTVLGGGVIACEYASTFAALGVHVTLIDRNPRPLGFVDEELSQGFVDSLKRLGNRCIANQRVRSVHWDGACSTVTELENGEQIRSEKCLVALGRVANTQRLRIDRAQIECRPSGTVITNEFGQSSRENIYAVGDVAGPPGLVAAAIEQGRRAVRSALKLDTGAPARFTPFAVYTIPEMSCVGMDERMAREAGEDVILGHARFDDLVRGKIAAITHGSLKLVADDCGLILGVQIFGEGAAELIAIGQMALRARMHVQDLVDTVFNFPTLSEAYRVAALDIARQWDGTCALPV